MAISDGDYNAARMILVGAGSMSAQASHVKHTQGAGSPNGHGVALLAQARNEFRVINAGQPNLQADMNAAHYNAIHAAAVRMGITNW